MADSASKEAQRTGRSTESILAPIRARLAALGSDERVQRWRWVAFPFTLWAVTRVAILGFGKLSMTFVPGLVESAGLHREYLLGHPSIEGLCRWDCRYFQELANHGYLHEGYTNFFPLYPLLVRALHEVTGLHIDLCLILVPNLAALGGLLVLYRLVTFLEDESAAKWTLMLFISFPFAFFQAMAYPESLMVLFTALAVYLALRGRHIWAGVALGVGVLARHLSFFAGGSLLVAQVKQRPSVRRFLLSPALLGLVIPWLFLGAYCAYQYVRFGNALAFVKMRDNWGPVAWWGVTDWWRHGPPRNVVMGSYVVFALPFGRRGDRVPVPEEVVGAGRVLRPDAPGALPQRHLGDGALHSFLLGGVRAARGLALPAAAAPDAGGGVLRPAAGDDVLPGAAPVQHPLMR